MTHRFIFTILFLFLFSVIYTQLPAKQENKVGFRSEWYGGLIFHTNGWGVNLTMGKFKTYKKYNEFSFDFVNIKHPKEYKIRYRFGQQDLAKAFKYGKLNSLYTARFSYGQQLTIFEKEREKGVQIYFNWKTGLSLGVIKPIYLEIYLPSTTITIAEERYNPDIHNESNIYGRGKFSSGLKQITIAPGAHFKGGFKFELAKNREKIFALETGVIIDVFPTGIPMLAYRDDEKLFYNLYINILFGKKYYD